MQFRKNERKNECKTIEFRYSFVKMREKMNAQKLSVDIVFTVHYFQYNTVK